MAFTILLTGFGPFPGAPTNPTGPLVNALARRCGPHAQGTRRIAYVFETSYAAIDRELPALLRRIRPQVLIMFGLARRSRCIRIETRARNELAPLPDATGQRPSTKRIASGAPDDMALPVPARQLLRAARIAGNTAELSGDAGGYLCNYLCWRACEAARRPRLPEQPRLRVAGFVHVPNVAARRRRPAAAARRRRDRCPVTPHDLLQAGEAVVRAAIIAARIRQ